MSSPVTVDVLWVAGAPLEATSLQRERRSLLPPVHLNLCLVVCCLWSTLSVCVHTQHRHIHYMIPHNLTFRTEVQSPAESICWSCTVTRAHSPGHTHSAFRDEGLSPSHWACVSEQFLKSAVPAHLTPSTFLDLCFHWNLCSAAYRTV